jgi:large subunit ribosomal protein L32e
MAFKFLRRDTSRHSRLGKKRKKLQTWRRPKGRDNKMREKRKGYPAVVSPGYKKSKDQSGKIDSLFPLRVFNVSDLDKANKNNIVIIASVGAKKKMEIIKEAQNRKLKIYNLNVGGKKDAISK